MHIVIPIDWSENAHEAFNFYMENLHRCENEIALVHHIDTGETSLLPGCCLSNQPSSPADLRRKEASLQTIKGDYEKILTEKQVTFQWVTCSGGNAGEEIVRTSYEQKADMIIMGARGLGKIRKAILGSVSDYVMRKAYIPVLIVKFGSYVSGEK